jgi:hypothetical protein
MLVIVPVRQAASGGFSIMRIFTLGLTVFSIAWPTYGVPQANPKEQQPAPQREIHNTIELPQAAHRAGETAGAFVDPITQNKVFRLSDRKLCPQGATHFYSYSNQFSPGGYMVFDCYSDPLNKNITTHPVYDRDFRLVFPDAESAASRKHRFGGVETLSYLQLSQTRDVLIGQSGMRIIELDPFHGTNRVFADFSVIKKVAGPGGTSVTVSTAREVSIGPGDRLMVHLQCRKFDKGCPGDWSVVGVAVYDPATRKYNAMYVPVPGDKAPQGFDEAQWSQNPAGRLTMVYGNAPNYTYSADLASRAQYDDNHGHAGYFCGSNGRCYRVGPRSDTLKNGGVGQIGCRDARGLVLIPWRTEGALYDDETGKRELIFGCDEPGQNPWEHLSRSPGAKDVFGISTKRYVFPPSLARFAPTDEAIVRAVVSYSEKQPAGVTLTPVAYHRSAVEPYSPRLGRNCGYWATPRLNGDFTGTRFLFDSSMSHPEWPATERGRTKTDCVTDVYVVEYSGK